MLRILPPSSPLKLCNTPLDVAKSIVNVQLKSKGDTSSSSSSLRNHCSTDHKSQTPANQPVSMHANKTHNLNNPATNATSNGDDPYCQQESIENKNNVKSTSLVMSEHCCVVCTRVAKSSNYLRTCCLCKLRW